MCVACHAAARRRQAAEHLLVRCKERFGYGPGFQQLSRPPDDHAFDSLLARLDTKQ